MVREGSARGRGLAGCAEPQGGRIACRIHRWPRGAVPCAARRVHAAAECARSWRGPIACCSHRTRGGGCEAMTPRLLPSLGVVASMVALHFIVGLFGAVSIQTNTALFAANVYVAYCGWLVAKRGRRQDLAGFAGGYLGLFLLVMVLLGSESLFLLLIIVYASVYRVRLLLGLFVAFVLSHVVL